MDKDKLTNRIKTKRKRDRLVWYKVDILTPNTQLNQSVAWQWIYINLN